MTDHQDPKGYYALLGLATSATTEEVKKAFKAKARDVHPDRNASPDATQEFQLLNDAYQTLSDPDSRVQYDAEVYAPPASETSADLEPVRCSRCNKVSAQPRYAIFRQVVSWLVVTQRSVVQGIFCSGCATKVVGRASVVTWLVGWWGFPWGPIFSIHALFQNLSGVHPPLNNFKVLSLQSIYFASIGRLDLASAVALDALYFYKQIPQIVKTSDQSIGSLMNAVGPILSLAKSKSVTLPKVWGIHSTAFQAQAFVITLVIASLGYLMVAPSTPNAPFKHVPPGEELNADVSPVTLFNEPQKPLPSTGHMRKPRSGGGGERIAPLTIVTAASQGNYYIKLVDKVSGNTQVVLFVRSGETADVEVPLGLYEFRYALGATWYGEELLFGPDTTYSKTDTDLEFRIEGKKVLGHTIELIKQTDGNLRESPLAPADF